MQTGNIIEDRVRPVWLHIVCYRDQAVDQHRDPNNRVLPNLEERREWGVGDAGLYQLFLWGFCWSQRRESLRERERESSQGIAGIAPTTWERGFPEQME